mgnify:CR=1 FL=1
MEKLPRLQDMPRQSATQVKNKWGEVLRQVQQSGSVAVTSHSNVEMVMLDAAHYQQLVESLDAHQERERAALDQLTQSFNANLAALQRPDAKLKAAAVFGARGKLVRRPKAGTRY